MYSYQQNYSTSNRSNTNPLYRASSSFDSNSPERLQHRLRRVQGGPFPHSPPIAPTSNVLPLLAGDRVRGYRDDFARSQSLDQLVDNQNHITPLQERVLGQRSSSYSRLAKQSCALFAPLPEYAKYQERKIQRVLSRRHMLSDPPTPQRNTSAIRRGSWGDLRDLNGALYCPSLDAEPEPLPPRRRILDPRSNIFESRTIHNRLYCNSRQEPCADPRKGHTDNTIDLAPGIKTRLRSAKDTIAAIHNGFHTSLACFGCSLKIYCIADAQYVICPVCRIISPLPDVPFQGERLEREGLGIGFDDDDLKQIQAEKERTTTATNSSHRR